jgi:2-oxoglutarate dehydrogenase E1 component
MSTGDDEAVVHAMSFALDFRMKFGRDVFYLLGYRKYGHNEGDEPRFTQPLCIKNYCKTESRDLYAAKLLSEGVIDIGFVKNLR